MYVVKSFKSLYLTNRIPQGETYVDIGDFPKTFQFPANFPIFMGEATKNSFKSSEIFPSFTFSVLCFCYTYKTKYLTVLNSLVEFPVKIKSLALRNFNSLKIFEEYLDNSPNNSDAFLDLKSYIYSNFTQTRKPDYFRALEIYRKSTGVKILLSEKEFFKFLEALYRLQEISK